MKKQIKTESNKLTNYLCSSQKTVLDYSHAYLQVGGGCPICAKTSAGNAKPVGKNASLIIDVQKLPRRDTAALKFPHNYFFQVCVSDWCVFLTNQDV